MEFRCSSGCHHKLLSNSERFKRHLHVTPSCELCFEGIEDLEHIFRGCSNAKEIWQELENEGVHCLGFDMDFHGWLQRNLLEPHADSDWATKFAIIIWYIWKWRCARCFERPETIPIEKGKFLCSQFHHIIRALTTDHPLPIRECPATEDQWIHWETPEEGWLVLNTDGAVKTNPSTAGAGGVIRGARGEWVLGFSEHLGYCSILKAELRGVLRGLQIAKERGISKLWLRTDSRTVMNILANPTVDHPKYFFIIQQCKKLLDWNGWTIRLSHCYREANQVADKLAKIGTEGSLGVTVYRAPPPTDP